ncbi:hypothetical protein PV11_04155 [Exophiala sideris]|uniref:YjgF-like protein n=1 Tax=Exophiala sideris TaxID=1016849 RepID=A0A0D1YLV2_9EURO|nr:hypothetical protein PV11_04155 [Exophiala sideris]
MAQYYNYPGTEANSESFHYSQAIQYGNTIKTSGQGGWNTDGSIISDPAAQVAEAFENVLRALQAADSSISWKNVCAIRSYHTNLDETFEHVTERFKRLMPDHRPIWTCVEIKKLGIPGMIIEIGVEAMLDA